jgi:salicylate hydroxylase
MLRADLQQILLRRVPEECKHLKKRLVRYQCSYSDPESPITLHFTDGTTTQCDVLIGADGVHSCIRGQMMKDAAEAVYVPPGVKSPIQYHRYIHPMNSGTIAYRALVNATVLRSKNPTHPILKSGQAVCVPFPLDQFVLIHTLFPTSTCPSARYNVL